MNQYIANAGLLYLSGWRWETPHGLNAELHNGRKMDSKAKGSQTRDGLVMWGMRRVTGGKKKTHCFLTPSFVLICHENKVQVREAPHLTCHVLCTSLRPNNLSLPSVFSISIKASFTRDGRTAFAFSVFLFEVSSELLSFYGVDVCTWAWMYPGLSRKDSMGIWCLFEFFFFISLSIILS